MTVSRRWRDGERDGRERGREGSEEGKESLEGGREGGRGGDSEEVGSCCDLDFGTDFDSLRKCIDVSHCSSLLPTDHDHETDLDRVHFELNIDRLLPKSS
jgi:hypothetical protein